MNWSANADLVIKFFFKLVDAQIDFVLEGGRASSLVLHQGGQHLPAPRKQ